MKLYFTLLTALVAGSSLFAQEKLDLASRCFINEKSELSEPSRLKSTKVETEKYQGVIIRLEEGQSLKELEEAGIDVSFVIADKFVVTNVTREQMAKLDVMESVRSVNASQMKYAKNNEARASVGVDKIHAGTDLAKAYDGSGVVVGIIDCGFDPNHVNFYNSTLTESRVKHMYVYTQDSNTGAVSRKDYASNLSSFTSDNSGECHGTHTSGIAVGGYQHKDAEKDFHGMAPAADIVLCAGSFSDNILLQAVADIKAYAESVNKPAVINMSLGANEGPHDGSDNFTAALNEYAKDIPICISSGNEAGEKIAITKTLSTASTRAQRIQTALVPSETLQSKSSYYQAYGTLYINADDDQDLSVSFLIVNKSDYSNVCALTVTNDVQFLSNSSIAESGHKTDTNFDKYYQSSYVGAVKYVNEVTGKTQVQFAFKLINKSTSTTVLPVVIVVGKDGQTLYAYADGYYTNLMSGSPTFDEPTDNGTINNMACGKNTISVGAYVTKNANPYTGNTIGDIAYFSSYGSLCDGRQLPTISAPGCALVSSLSQPFVEGGNYNSTYYPKTFGGKFNNRYHYWTPMQGTSMAAPVMTGTVALWLQANPELTPAEIAEIAQSTAVKTSYYSSAWGPAGQLNAYEGLKAALETTSAERLIADKKAPVLVSRNGSDYEVFVANADNVDVTVYNMAGSKVASTSSFGNTANINTSNLMKGVYVISVTSAGVTHKEKIVVR